MNSDNGPVCETTVVMEAIAMAAAIHRMAQEIVAANEDVSSLAFLGILSRGRPLAERLAAQIDQMTGVAPPVGSLATTLYRDDLRAGVGTVKIGGGTTHFAFPIDGKTVVLVDDVLAAGRTIRAALDEVMDYGRPARIQLACLVDRGGRELPIQPDYLGWSVATRPDEWVSVRLREMDGQDIVLLERRSLTDGEGGS
ncbi:MAG TPA: bifunctional pyr operon transcriptional regulator/uracil phosphoribosyltransferase PyrR [Candidatus Hydrogenedentes bacterium]|nr:bifunctional pyr operon transcriptional regulator/uracil phosphoribosyltransferase PyrR [Candidatus Hydrogenedentota bacterium]HOV74677.1 bifunctional pyr operon transcriptional regulator/uracil phosphoribosyltransferase PyrR [Candidatus Hydrogenedentota bacterium]HPC15537.1 bifunctional pyr operon transcriptional regulator/uracil phosphoribosyltransferase PyrR [Candidatus Hydrogenedentota bacterium]HRT19357.1 bifunctional pyr operon transcriptional regulator/uracil phosphoribosyltransferase 